MNQKKYFTPRRMAVIAMVAALVFVFTYIGIDIPSPLGKTKVHMGNVMCLLGGLLFGGLPGGLAAGIGSGLFDLMDPAWAPEFWITAINKFVMAFVAGSVAEKLKHHSKLHLWAGGVAGAVAYSTLYVLKNIISGHFIKGFAWNIAILETVTTKLPVTLINAFIAVVCAVMLYVVLYPALKRAGLFKDEITQTT